MTGSSGADPIRAFYDEHPYPPPVTDLATSVGDAGAVRFDHHLVWPRREPASVRSVLIAGCGTSQAVRHAAARPDADVVAVDVALNSVEHTRALARREQVTNLEAHHLAIEDVGDLDQRFDLIVCTGVLHHLADPAMGLRSLRSVLAPRGAIKLMVYAPYGRAGVYLIQDYCRRLGVQPTSADLGDLVATLREIPIGHPIGRLLRETRDFADDDALADALLNPRDRAYSVPELYELVDGAGLRLARWERQAPYLPWCGSISETPHAARLQRMDPADQHAALELFRGTMLRHTAILVGDDEEIVAVDADAIDGSWVPVPAPTAVAVEERVPRGVAAALINRAHTDTDLVLFVDDAQLGLFRAIDGRRRVDDLAGEDGSVLELLVALWRHDLVVFDALADPAVSAAG